jgi:hypothetical protein
MRALLVGISAYGPQLPALGGTVNDMLAWRDLLTGTFGIRAEDIRLLSDKRATRAAVIERLKWLLDPAGGAEPRLFIFAGHGDRIRRRDARTGALGKYLEDVIVCCPESDHGDLERCYVSDVDLEAIVGGALPKSSPVTLIIDACHSGGLLTVSPSGLVARKAVTPPDIEHRSYGAPADVRRLGSGELHKGEKPLLVAAAGTQELAWDEQMSDGRRHGVFTYYAVHALRTQRELTYRQLVDRITPEIASRFAQHPQLEGPTPRRDRAFFS